MRRLLILSFLFFLLFSAKAAFSLQLITLGDSLTEGVGDSRYNNQGTTVGYPERLEQSLATLYSDITLHNLGRSGWTSNELIEGSEWDGPGQLNQALELINTASSKQEQSIVLVWIGSNDLYSIFEWYENRTHLDEDLANFSKQIQIILQQLSQTGAMVYIALLDDQSRRPVLANPEYAADFENITPDKLPLMSDYIKKYNAVITELAHQYGAVTTDFYHTTLFETNNTLSEDGNHPNATGYDQITTIWYDSLTSPRVILDTENKHSTKIQAGITVDARINMESKLSNGHPGDWWLVLVDTTGKLLSFNLQLQKFEQGLKPVYQGVLLDFSNLMFHLNTNDWPPGTYFLFFGIDKKQDGQLNSDIYYDWITIIVE